jgi:hypothetical protein
MNKTLLIITALMLIVGCSKKTDVKINGSTEKVTSSSQVSIEKEPIYDSTLVRKDGQPWDGKQTWWYDNGQKELEGTYKDGKKDGIHTIWYENGQKKSEATYKDGEFDGLYTEWNENGQKEEEQTYKNGKLIDLKEF